MMRDRKPLLSIEQVLAWADAHYKRTGRWPHSHSGPIRGAPNENWAKINYAATRGRRGLPGGMSLSALLDKHRGQRAKRGASPLTVEQILAWAESHRRRTGAWPILSSGSLAEDRSLTWKRINSALWQGLRGLRGGDSLAKLLRRHRNLQKQKDGDGTRRGQRIITTENTEHTEKRQRQ
jgi:hypothetical protein